MMTSYVTVVENDLFAKHGHKENIVSGILIMDDKWNQMVAMADIATFKTLWETSESTSSMRAALQALEMDVEFMQRDLDEKERRLAKEYDMAAKRSMQLKDWPTVPTISGTTAEQQSALDKYNEEIKFFYETSIARMRHPLSEHALVDAAVFGEDHLVGAEQHDVAHRLAIGAEPLEAVLAVAQNVALLSGDAELAELLAIRPEEEDRARCAEDHRVRERGNSAVKELVRRDVAAVGELASGELVPGDGRVARRPGR